MINSPLHLFKIQIVLPINNVIGLEIFRCFRDVDEKAVELQAESNEVRRLRISFRDMEIK